MQKGAKLMNRVAEMTKNGGNAIITIKNPPVNVLTFQVRDEIRECVAEVQNDSSVKCVIITGEGKKAFMAGADIKSFPDMCGVYGEAYGFARTVYEVWDMIEQLEKPTIAAVNGLALGAGLELALTCDIRIAEEPVKFGLPEITLGLFPGGGGTQRLQKLVGAALTKEMVFTGKPITAERALQAGLINEITPEGGALDRAVEMGELIGKYSAPIVALAKKAVNGGIGVSLREGISVEAELWQDAFMTEDIKEGVTAFIEKREPRFMHK